MVQIQCYQDRQTEGRTDRRHAIARPRFALNCIARQLKPNMCTVRPDRSRRQAPGLNNKIVASLLTAWLQQGRPLSNTS